MIYYIVGLVALTPVGLIYLYFYYKVFNEYTLDYKITLSFLMSLILTLILLAVMPLPYYLGQFLLNLKL